MAAQIGIGLADSKSLYSTDDKTTPTDTTHLFTIKEITIEGNKAIKTEALMEAMTKNDLAEGQIFQRGTLDGILNELERHSVYLGVLNLLPIPVLDGGHILYSIAEAIKGSPLSERVQMFGYSLGLVILAGVMVVAFYNDLLRL